MTALQIKNEISRIITSYNQKVKLYVTEGKMPYK